MCSSPTGPSELGWPRRQPWREGASRTLEATMARCRNAWLPRPRAGGMGVRSSCGSQGPERVRCRPSGSTTAQGARVGSDPRSVRGQRPSDFPRPRGREACRADAYGNRTPSQLVSKGSRPSGSTRAVGNPPAREGLAGFTSSTLHEFIPFLEDFYNKCCERAVKCLAHSTKLYCEGF